MGHTQRICVAIEGGRRGAGNGGGLRGVTRPTGRRLRRVGGNYGLLPTRPSGLACWVLCLQGFVSPPRCPHLAYQLLYPYDSPHNPVSLLLLMPPV